VEETDRYDARILALLQERDGIETHVRSFPNTLASVGEKPGVAAASRDAIAERIAAMRRINPTIPPVPEQEQKIAPQEAEGVQS